MTVFTEGRHAAEFVLNEDGGSLSRDTIEIDESQDIVPGEVLGKVTASGKYLVLNPTATDGSEKAAALPLYGAKTGLGESTKIAGITRLAKVNGKLLTWPVGITAEQKAAAISQLGEKHIAVR
jgi:hypothetical protein